RALELLERLLLDGRDVVDAGVVDEHVELPERVHRFGDRSRPVLGRADVVVAVTRRGTDVLGDRRAVLVEHVGQHDLGAFPHKEARLRLALPARRAGDQRDLALESAHYVSFTDVGAVSTAVARSTRFTMNSSSSRSTSCCPSSMSRARSATSRAM